MAKFSVMTWNMENLYRPNGEYGPKSQSEYDNKLKNLADIILNLNPDVLAVQEVGNQDAFNDLSASLQGNYPYSILSKNPDPRGIRVGFLSKLQIEDSEEIVHFPNGGLTSVPGIDSKGNPTDVSSFGRGALRILVKPSFPLNLITAHLKSKLLTYPTASGKSRFTPKDENEHARVAGIALLKRTAEAIALRVKANNY